jgi:hypothetical protein
VTFVSDNSKKRGALEAGLPDQARVTPPGER